MARLTDSPGEPDAGSAEYAANLSYWQEAQGLPATGVIDASTMQAFAGYWQSQTRISDTEVQLHLNVDGQPVYLQCLPASACREAGREGRSAGRPDSIRHRAHRATEPQRKRRESATDYTDGHR